MTYTCKLATLKDAPAIAPLWKNFAQDRAAVDPSMQIKPDFDFEQYITHQLKKTLSYCWVLENTNSGHTEIVGCLFVYFYDEAPPPQLPPAFQENHQQDNPFCDRRVGSVLGLYVQPEHRNPQSIKLLANAGLQKAQELQASDLDILVGADQKGMQSLLQRMGFTPSAVQFTKHYNIAQNAALPSLHPPHPELDLPELPQPGAISLRDPNTNELVKNPQGEPVFLFPLQDIQGKLLKTEQDLPIYPTPVRDPQTQDYVFDTQGKLVVCPVLKDDQGAIATFQGIPQFHPPAYQTKNGKLYLKQDEQGNYQFCPVEKDTQGKIVYSPSGQPLFKTLTGSLR